MVAVFYPCAQACTCCGPRVRCVGSPFCAARGSPGASPAFRFTFLCLLLPLGVPLLVGRCCSSLALFRGTCFSTWLQPPIATAHSRKRKAPPTTPGVDSPEACRPHEEWTSYPADVLQLLCAQVEILHDGTMPDMATRLVHYFHLPGGAETAPRHTEELFTMEVCTARLPPDTPTPAVPCPHPSPTPGLPTLILHSLSRTVASSPLLMFPTRMSTVRPLWFRRWCLHVRTLSKHLLR